MRLKKLMRDIISIRPNKAVHWLENIFGIYVGFFLLKRVRILYLFALYACKQQ